MLGSGLAGRSRGEDRFYNPPKARGNYQSQHSDSPCRAQSDGAAGESPSARDVKSVSASTQRPDPRRGPEEPTKPAATPNSELVVSPSSNLKRFLEAVRPSVPIQYPSKTTMRGRRAGDAEFQPYFVLGDLWESFEEWSAYGAGVPLILNESDSVVQYYVPYLSGIQIYGDSRKPSMELRRPGEDSDGDYFRDSSSDGSSDFESEGPLRCPLGQWNPNHIVSESTHRMHSLSLRDQHTACPEEFSSDEGEPGNDQGSLLFEYLERDRPYCREPLADKICCLACRFPELKTLRSCDLLRSSWISVAWYPIYRIPMGPTLKDLDACFLTFHSLHTPIRGAQDGQASATAGPSEADGAPRISLPVFGMASYKFRGSLWTHKGGYDHQLSSSLLQAADVWLRLLQVNHPDFLFFSGRS